MSVIELMRVPVISSRHVTAECADWLDEVTGQPDSALCGFKGGYGWILFVGEDPLGPDCPHVDVLNPIFTWAKFRGYSWVRLDADADTTQGVPTYDW